MARYSIILCLALFCVAALAGGYDEKCDYSYDAVPRTGAGGYWTACTGPESNRKCSFYQIYDIVIKAGAKSKTVTACDFVYRPANGKIIDSWGINYGNIVLYNPVAAGQTYNSAGFIVRADNINDRIRLDKTDRYPCECKDYY